MRIFNQEKTEEIFENELNYELGYLKADKLVIAHHEAIPFKRGRTVEEIVTDLKIQGIDVEIGADGHYYKIIEVFTNGGRNVELIVAEPDMPAKDAYDEYEDIQIYVLYTEEELKYKLRIRREKECFNYINRGMLWYETLTMTQREELQVWYFEWLNVTQTFIIPKKPMWLK